MRKITTLLMILAMSFIAFAQNVNVSFKLRAINVDGVAVDTTNGVWIVGDFNGWKFSQLEDLGNHEYVLDTVLKAGDTTSFYFILVNSWDSAGNQDWNYYKRFREYPDTADVLCNPSWAKWKGDRWLAVPNKDTVIYVAWGLCGSLSGGTKVKTTNSLIAAKIYPNPAKNYVNIKLDSKQVTTIEIFDVTGKKLRSLRTFNDAVSIDIAGLPSSVYFIKITNNSGTLTQKITVK